MALEAKTTLIPHKKAKTLYLTIPASVADDSAFPFKPGEEVKVIIKGSKLVVEK
ncbi:MAG: hypothetical protein QXL86_01215 [Candidatus Aenigmatarchaeota archaeon]